MTWTRDLPLLLVGLATACGAPPREAEPTGRALTTAAPPPADSLVVRTPAGIEIWFTASRNATDPAGQRCVERTLQIRRDSLRTNIPLLYTGSLPVLVDDSTIEAAIWLHCRPGNVYRVNLRTGQPVRVR